MKCDFLWKCSAWTPNKLVQLPKIQRCRPMLSYFSRISLYHHNVNGVVTLRAPSFGLDLIARRPRFSGQQTGAQGYCMMVWKLFWICMTCDLPTKFVRFELVREPFYNFYIFWTLCLKLCANILHYMDKFWNPATHTMSNPRAPKSQCFSTRVSDSR